MDFKTTGKSLYADMETSLVNYRAQCGAYSLMLKHLTGIQVEAGAIVTARRSGEPVTTMLNREELGAAENRFLARCEQFFDDIYLEMLRNPQKGS